VASFYLPTNQSSMEATNSVLAVCLASRELFLCAMHPS
jgi:hypothetical protein